MRLTRRGIVKSRELELSFDVVRQATAQAVERYRMGGRDAIGFGVDTLLLLIVACQMEAPAKLVVEAAAPALPRAS